ncbi:hypothetical protein [Delftia acidovorans]|uniref:hypothetical protein n=1 Tax=Delftia acidovorans TaxID=80866 RepID=UPI003342DFEB
MPATFIGREDVISVYLDSQDYSTLSNSILSEDLRSIKEKLMEYANSGVVSFYFSSLIVSEASPSESAAIQHAIRRGDFLTEICKRNALRFNHDVINDEVRLLVESGNERVNAICANGDWFPAIEFPEAPSLTKMAKVAIQNEVVSRNLGRKERRAAERKVIKNGGMKPEMRKALLAISAASYVNGVMEKYPMQPWHAEVLSRYCLGEATKDEAAEAFRDSLRDPCWLMRWFVTEEELAIPLVSLVRKPGREIGERIRWLISLAEDIRGIEDILEVSPLSRANWGSLVDKGLIDISTSVAEHLFPDWRGQFDAKTVAAKCPGLTAMIGSIYSSMWDNVSGSRKALPSDSQFPDAMHAVYAPYVDLFRADRYMAPHIQKHVGVGGAQVVSKLADLPKAIEQRLRAASPV